MRSTFRHANGPVRHHTLGGVVALACVALTPVAAGAAEEGSLEVCQAAVESFPPLPCAGEPIPLDTRRPIKKVRTLLEPTAAATPRRAERVALLLQRAQNASSEAERDGRLSPACTQVLNGLLRNARACVAVPLLREQKKTLAAYHPGLSRSGTCQNWISTPWAERGETNAVL